LKFFKKNCCLQTGSSHCTHKGFCTGS